MRSDAGWSRREFVTTAGLAVAATALPAARADAAWSSAGAEDRPYALYLTHSLVMAATVRSSIVTVHVNSGEWTTPSPEGTKSGWAAKAIARHPALPVLYVAHGQAMDRHGQPRAGVTAYAIDEPEGALRAKETQPLALSSSLARDLAVSPDGRSLLAAGTVGGVYSVLPLAEDGSMGAVAHALKMTGGGPWRTLPHLWSVLFHPSGTAYGTDTPMNRVHVISFANEAPEVTQRVSLPPAFGPTTMALSPRGDALFAVSRWRPGFAVIPVYGATGALAGEPRMEVLQGRVGNAVAVNAAGDRVYAATQEDGCASGRNGGSATVLSVFAYGGAGGRLRLMERVRVPEILDARRLVLHGGELLTVGMGGVVAMRVKDASGRLGTARHVVQGGPFSDAVVRVL